jgi:predicted ArsR family transcriptional regulator
MEDIPNPVQSFVRENIASVGMLELLLVLEADPERAWTAAELSAELRVHRDGVANFLEHLRVRGLVDRNGGPEPRFRYAAPSASTRSTLPQLRKAFETRRVQLATVLYGRRGWRPPRGDGG